MLGFNSSQNKNAEFQKLCNYVDYYSNISIEHFALKGIFANI